MLRPITTPSLIIMLCFCSFPMCVHLKAATNQQQQLRELEERWLASEDNPDALASILADDFIHVLPSGLVTKSDQIRYLRSHPTPQHAGAKHFQDMRIRVFGSVGIVNGVVEATQADGRVRKTIFTDVFAYREGRWQAVNGQETPLNDSAHQ